MGSRLVFANANLFDGHQPMEAESHVVVDDNKIIAVGHDSVGMASDRLIDLKGRTLMPGMTIGHYHGAVRRGAPAYSALYAGKVARETLLSGFTHAVSAGCPGYLEPSLVQAIDEGWILGPRILPGSRDVSGTGNNIDTLAPWYRQNESVFNIRNVDGPAEMVHAIRDEVKHGAKVIKLLITGGHGAFVAKGTWEISREELKVAIDTAHERGVLIRGHLAGKEAVLTSVELGLDIVDHGDDIDDECIAAMVERGTFLAPSCGFPKVWLERGGSDSALFYREDLDYMLNILPAANEAGVKMLVGDDYFTFFGPGDEMEVYVKDAKIPELDVLRWLTKNGADSGGRLHDLGTIEAGKLADMIVVDGDPSQDITLFKDSANILAVIKDGQFAKDELYRIS
jgi:imidazolonepropionase-like amidohydrolase